MVTSDMQGHSTSLFASAILECHDYILSSGQCSVQLEVHRVFTILLSAAWSSTG